METELDQLDELIQLAQMPRGDFSKELDLDSKSEETEIVIKPW